MCANHTRQFRQVVQTSEMQSHLTQLSGMIGENPFGIREEEASMVPDVEDMINPEEDTFNIVNKECIEPEETEFTPKKV